MASLRKSLLFQKFCLLYFSWGNLDLTFLVGNHKFCSSAKGMGFAKLIPLQHLNDSSKGFMLGNTVIVEVQIPLMTVVKEFS